MAENARESGRDDFQRLLHNVRVRAGFVCLKNCELDRAKELFIKGMVDPREVVASVCAGREHKVPITVFTLPPS